MLRVPTYGAIMFTVDIVRLHLHIAEPPIHPVYFILCTHVLLQGRHPVYLLFVARQHMAMNVVICFLVQICAGLDISTCVVQVIHRLWNRGARGGGGGGGKYVFGPPE